MNGIIKMRDIRTIGMLDTVIAVHFTEKYHITLRRIKDADFHSYIYVCFTCDRLYGNMIYAGNSMYSCFKHIDDERTYNHIRRGFKNPYLQERNAFKPQASKGGQVRSE